MTFTYNGDLATDLDYIRFKVGDTTSGSGVKPRGGNFTDEEINGLLSIEGDNTNRTIAGMFEALAAIWANYVDTKIGPRDEKLSKIADRYKSLAKQWRDDYGVDDSIATVTVGTINLGIDEEDEDFDIT